jgi:hypothetical protein
VGDEICCFDDLFRRTGTNRDAAYVCGCVFRSIAARDAFGVVAWCHGESGSEGDRALLVREVLAFGGEEHLIRQQILERCERRNEIARVARKSRDRRNDVTTKIRPC